MQAVKSNRSAKRRQQRVAAAARAAAAAAAEAETSSESEPEVAKKTEVAPRVFAVATPFRRRALAAPAASPASGEQKERWADVDEDSEDEPVAVSEVSVSSSEAAPTEPAVETYTPLAATAGSRVPPPPPPAAPPALPKHAPWDISEEVAADADSGYRTKLRAGGQEAFRRYDAWQQHQDASCRQPPAQMPAGNWGHGDSMGCVSSPYYEASSSFSKYRDGAAIPTFSPALPPGQFHHVSPPQYAPANPYASPDGSCWGTTPYSMPACPPLPQAPPMPYAAAAGSWAPETCPGAACPPPAMPPATPAPAVFGGDVANLAPPPPAASPSKNDVLDEVAAATTALPLAQGLSKDELARLLRESAAADGLYED